MTSERQYNKIIIKDADYFSPRDTLECGQVFRFKKLGEEEYDVYSKDNYCHISKKENTVTITSSNPDYFYTYFDLSRDYSTILKDLSIYEELQMPIIFGKGIRILQQDPLEMIISFIISSSNNIPRIKGIIERLCQNFGSPTRNEYNAFPTLEQLQRMTRIDFELLRAGYRGDYLFEMVKSLSQSDFIGDLLKLETSDQMLKKLLTLKGVGPKVADCILLFGLKRMDSFPVDTWVFQAGQTEELNTKEKVRKFYSDKYGNLSGFAQQYLFYYQRSYK